MKCLVVVFVQDLTSIQIGELFTECFLARITVFEEYCIRQASASLLLNQLEKDKELLRIFLKVSQMENPLLRRMNLRSFLVVPVQRVTKYVFFHFFPPLAPPPIALCIYLFFLSKYGVAGSL